MGLADAVQALATGSKTPVLKRMYLQLTRDIDAGIPLTDAAVSAHLIKPHTITHALLTLGESSGRLAKNLQLIAENEQKNREFRSQVLSAFLYPILVFSLTIVIGIGIAWFILPQLAIVFDELHIAMPLLTRIVLGIGKFLSHYGAYTLVGAVAIILSSLYVLFGYEKTKYLGQGILFSLPGIQSLLYEIELSRLGYIMGTLLEAGVPMDIALNSLHSATNLVRFQKFYTHLAVTIAQGDSFQESFNHYPKSTRLIPHAIQQVIVAGEQSSSLGKIFSHIGRSYEQKIAVSTKNIATLIEPILLIIVWLGVMIVALAVIVPLYGLIGSLNE
jgi:type II secretory pathway component PulF